jgi:GlcNAc-P-P-Und epimerase
MQRIFLTGASGFIGTHLVDRLSRDFASAALLNIDVKPPKLKEHLPYWRECDIMDKAKLEALARSFCPDVIIHLAARTDMEGTSVDSYAVNSVGTRHLAEVAQIAGTQRVIFTSTQYVVGPGRLPEDEFDFRPHTIYGQSKVLGEKAIQAAAVQYTWTIIRPTNIWGSYHPRYPSEFWRILKQGKYIHPGQRPVMRCYGFVGNVVDQMLTILEKPAELVSRKVFYVGDPAINLLDWVNAFSEALTGKPSRVVPRAAVAALAKVGDLVIGLGGQFPIFSSRYHSMTEEYLTPMQPTLDALGPPKFTLQEGVEATVAWLRTQGSFWN